MLLITVLIVHALIALVAIILHYEVLYNLNHAMTKIKHIQARYKVLIAVAIIALAHIAEITIFAFGYYVMLHFPSIGYFVGTISDDGLLLDSFYFSLITFTTIGYGDIVINGYLRYLTGIEALTGLILITWSASFLFLEMQKYWNSKNSSS